MDRGETSLDNSVVLCGQHHRLIQHSEWIVHIKKGRPVFVPPDGCRYWCRGPQRTLYVPGPVLRPTGNEVLVLELESGAPADVVFVPSPDLGEASAPA